MKLLDPISRWMTPSPVTVTADRGFAAARSLLRRHRIHHLPVLDNGKLAGLLVERDLDIAERFPEARHMTLAQILSPDPYVVGPSAPLGEVAEEMTNRRCNAAIVVDDGHVIGVFTGFDALRALAVEPVGHAEHEARP